MTTKRQFLYVLTFLASCHLIHGTSIAAPVFFDDVADRDIYDDEPVSWVGGGGDNFSADEEDEFGLVMDSEGIVRAGVRGLDLTDMSVRARVRVMEGGEVGIASRWQPGGPNGSSYYSYFGSGSAGIGIGGRSDILNSGGVGDVHLSDVMLQLDVIGDQIDFWVWDPDELMPEKPTVSAEHSDITSGDFYIWGGGSFGPQPMGPISVDIRYVEVADLHILTGDFNRDGSLDINDVDALAAAVRNNDSSLKHDVNNDEIIDNEDHRFWVKQLNRTYFGDANLDGEFNSADFVEIFQVGEFEDDIAQNSTWATGDWNGDGEFGSADFVLAFQDGGFEQGPLAALRPVPEPTGFVLIGFAMVAFAIQRPRRHARIGSRSKK